MGQAGLLLVALLSISAARPAAAAPAIEAYGHLPSVDLIALSPDGSKLALAVGDETRRQVQIRSTSDRKVIQMVGTGRAKIRSIQWAGENHVVITTSTTSAVPELSGPKREYGLAIDFNLMKRKLTPLLDGDVTGVPRKLNTIAGQPTLLMLADRPTAYLEGISFPESRGLLTLFKVDLDSGRTTKVVQGNEDTRGWLIDAAGLIAARGDYVQASGRFTLWTRGQSSLVKSLVDVHPIDSPAVTGFGRTPNTVLIAVHDDEHTTYHEMPLGADKLSPALDGFAEGHRVDDPKTGQLIGVRRDEGLGVAYSFFAPADNDLWAKVGRAFPKAVVLLEAWSDDRKKIVLRVESKEMGAAYYLLDTATHHADWLANEYAEIQPEDVAEKRAIEYSAGDGLKIPAYLTLPPGQPEKGLPLVVLAHGGPSARDAAGFDWWAQALASRGYAVLQPQFRGSAGFGQRFLSAGYGEWGRKMQTDLSDGVKHLAAAGTIDPARVCIVGASYGGYAALAGVTVQTGIYRCAVSLAGPSDLREMLSWEESMTGGARNRTLRHWQRFMGAKSPSDPMLDTISPAKLASRVTVPILLLHGADDTVVAYAQSQEMASSLRRAGKPVQFVTLKGEDHWLSRSDTRAEMLRATAAFLSENLPPVLLSDRLKN